MNDSQAQAVSKGTRWCNIGSWLCGIGLAAAIIGLGGAATDLLSPLSAFMAYGIGGLLCLIGILLLVIGLLRSGGTGGDIATGRAWGALIAGIVLIGASLALRPASSGAPPIHDLSTDLSNPPAFDRIIALRAADGAKNPPEYAGAETAAAQAKAFPDLKTLVLVQPRDEVFAAAQATARDLGWEIAASDVALGRIEATETTRWFHFRDDIVIRISTSGTGTAVDVRSKSRVGQGDMGANAARIRAFLDGLQARLS